MIKKSLIIVLLVLSNCQYKSSDEEEKLRILGGIVLAQLFPSTVSSASVTCTTSSPSFSTLQSAGVNTSCGRSGCHSGASPQSGYDASSYSSTISRVVARNPSSSLLYQKINGGSMAQYSSTSINSAIFCWIQGGAIQ